MKKCILLFLLFSLLFLACNQKDNTDKQVDIAFNLPLSGDLSTYGDAIQDGANMAVEDIQKTDKDFKCKLLFQDNAQSGKNASSVYQQQKISDIDIYVSGVKPQTMSIIDNVSKTNIPHFVWVFDANICSQYPNTFRSWVSYKIEPGYYEQYINKIKPKKIAITYVQLPHTEEEFNKNIIPSLQGKYDLLVEPYQYGKDNFQDISTKIRYFKPDLTIVNGFKDNIIRIVRNFKELGITNNNGNTICTYDFLDATEDLSNEVENGIRFISPSFLFDSTGTFNDWKSDFLKRYGRTPRYTDAYAYDMIYAIYHASKNVKDYSDHDQWRHNLLQVNFKGVTGDFRFDSAGDLTTKLGIFYMKDGKVLSDTL